ncbi:hypothetical protein [Pararhodospirillum photometricum]|uniref:Flagellar protein FliL n=1 Tax=Pararhodospirillum photometricum DSM 122 TaxID=1150469 RepID=H6SRK7_PARPM|nr:hypothetical protein [Pararhodospirillum photometricum]CCG07536.1 Putative uncharacterized protein [Pararhodospirillum photometricum DSM 122]
MIKILIALVVLVVLAGGGGAAGMAMGYLPDIFHLFPQAPTVSAPLLPPTPRQRLGPPPFLLSMKPLEIPVIQNGEVTRRLSIRLRLHLQEADNSTLSQRGHLLHAAFFQDMMGFMPQLMEGRTDVDLRAIKDRLKVVADRVVGAGVIKEILIQGYFER